MSERLGYEDWDVVVLATENNIEILEGNIRRATAGIMTEKATLGVAKRERRKYPESPEEPTEEPTESA